MRRFSAVLLVLSVMVGAGVATAPKSSAFVGTLVADYRFADSLMSSVAGAPALEVVGSGTGFNTETIDNVSDRVFTWPAGSGLRLPRASSIVGESYTMVLFVRSEYIPTEPEKRAKIVDWHDGRSWNGLYFEYRCYNCTDGVRPMFPYTANGAYVSPNTWTQLVIVRHASSSASPNGNQVQTYLDGNLSTGFAEDNGPDATSCQARVGGCNGSLGDAIRFFLPNTSVPPEPVQQASGAVARIRIYQGAMTQQEVQALERAGDVDGQMSSPTPGGSSPSPSPSPTQEPPTRQCNDGQDNDGDGKTDLDDGGCSRGLDDDERSKVTVKTKITIDRDGNAFFGKVEASAKECRSRNVGLVRTTFVWDEYRIHLSPNYKNVAKGKSDGAGRYRLKDSNLNDEASYYAYAGAQTVKARRAIYVCKKATSPWYDMPSSPR